MVFPSVLIFHFFPAVSFLHNLFLREAEMEFFMVGLFLKLNLVEKFSGEMAESQVKPENWCQKNTLLCPELPNKEKGLFICFVSRMWEYYRWGHCFKVSHFSQGNPHHSDMLATVPAKCSRHYETKRFPSHFNSITFCINVTIQFCIALITCVFWSSPFSAKQLLNGRFRLSCCGEDFVQGLKWAGAHMLK